MLGFGSKADKTPALETAYVAGLMQDRPINLIAVLQHAATVHAAQVVVSVLPEGVRRLTYRELYGRTQRLANALRRLGLEPGDRVGTIAFNSDRHVEAWYAVSGQGAICHTINPRLPPDQLCYILNHAEDRILMVDALMAPALGKVRAQLPFVKQVIVLADRSRMPPREMTGGEEWLCYEDLVAAETAAFDWPSFPEDTASSLCYTSGTTGEPKGVLYSHRSNLLMSYAIGSKDALNLGVNDASLMVVPMFHANAWGLVYGAPMVGAKIVLPGAALDGASVHRLIKEEGVTSSAAVPTVWAMLLAHLEQHGGDLAPLKEVVIGGAAVPRAMIKTLRDKYGVAVAHGWGMTELSPVGTVNRPLPKHAKLDPEAQLDEAAKQGRPLFGVEMKIVDEAGAELPRDGATAGRLLVRGPWIAKAYYKRPERILDADGWFDTGDVGTIDADGCLVITDRAKDIIKSGGEWISSVELETCAMGAGGVAMACAIGLPHPTWGERPLLLVVPKPGAAPSAESILDHLAGRCAKWQLPDAVVFVEALPMGPTGKLDKKVLKVQYKDHFAA